MELCPFCGDEFTTGEGRGDHLAVEHGQEMADVLEESYRRIYHRRDISRDITAITVIGLALLLALVGTRVRRTRFGRRPAAWGTK